MSYKIINDTEALMTKIDDLIIDIEDLRYNKNYSEVACNVKGFIFDILREMKGGLSENDI